MLHYSLYINTFGFGNPPAQWELRPSIEMQRLYYIRGGRGYYLQTDGTRCPFVPDTFYLFPYNLKACFYSDAADPINHVYFDFLSTPPIISDAPIQRPAASADLRSLAELLCTILQKPHAGREAIGNRLLDLALMLWNEEQPLPFSVNSAVCAALEYIQANYAQPISIAQLAAHFHFEENYFIRRFKAEMGQTPYAYLRAYRLMRADELLERGCSLAYAAEQVGYENASSLSRALRDRSGRNGKQP